MAHYTFPPGAAESVSGVTLPEYVVEAGRAAYAFDDTATEGIMYTIPNLPSLSGDLNFEILGYASGTTGSATISITPYSYTPSAAGAEGSWLESASGWHNTSSFSISAGATAYELSKGTLAYTPVNAMTSDYFAFKVEKTGGSVSGDFRIVGTTLTF